MSNGTTAIPPDDASRKLTVANPDDPKMRHLSIAGGTIRSSSRGSRPRAAIA
jgi:hypothetical protein